MCLADQLIDRTKRYQLPPVYALNNHWDNDNRTESDNRNALAKIGCPGS